MASYTFDQLIDIPKVKSLLEASNAMTEMAYGLFDANENKLVAVGWQDICVQFHREHPISCARCRESDAHIKAHLCDLSDDGLEYRCNNGMIDVAMPIVVDGEHLATFFAGQFFYEDGGVNLDYFIAQAEELGFDRTEYLHALDRVPVLNSEHVRGNIRFLSNMVKMLAETGLANLKLVREIEERTRIQHVLMEAQKLESLAIQVGGIAHDFSNLLVAVSGNISVAMKHIGPESPAMGWMVQSDKAAQRAVKLVRRLIVSSKGGTSARTPVSVREIVEESVTMALQGTPIQGEIHVSDFTHLIPMNAEQLLQVCSNIAINAVQAMPDGGALYIDADNASCDECRERGLTSGTYVRLAFRDEGGGISEENKKKLFDPFYTTKKNGSGLGLASTEAIVRNHNGRIFVSSTLGIGTTFTVYLPSIGCR